MRGRMMRRGRPLDCQAPPATLHLQEIVAAYVAPDGLVQDDDCSPAALRRADDDEAVIVLGPVGFLCVDSFEQVGFSCIALDMRAIQVDIEIAE